jgi:hypothetical protein
MGTMKDRKFLAEADRMKLEINADFPCTSCTASTKEGQYSAAAAGKMDMLNA